MGVAHPPTWTRSNESFPEGLCSRRTVYLLHGNPTGSFSTATGLEGNGKVVVVVVVVVTSFFFPSFFLVKILNRRVVRFCLISFSVSSYS